ncbi:2-hydroxycarboxylate transporter family protein, partial [Lactococcus lactis]|uniref:2-hydroxycarboxylate transporter family protein n=1 Tax=Lactococcus lactis TaxID=1358 RepID=UPI0030D98594
MAWYFLGLYIVSLIASSLFKMDRKMLLKAAVRFLPVAFISMALTAVVIGIVGVIIGVGFNTLILYIAMPIMAGGVGAGIVPTFWYLCTRDGRWIRRN